MTASAESLHELHQQVVLALVECTRPGSKPSAELLQVARRLCRDNGLLGLAQSDTDRKRLQRLYRLYLQRIEQAITTPNPPAAVLGEVRVFLQAQGITKDLGEAIDTATALKALGSAALPFTNH